MTVLATLMGGVLGILIGIYFECVKIRRLMEAWS